MAHKWKSKTILQLDLFCKMEKKNIWKFRRFRPLWPFTKIPFYAQTTGSLMARTDINQSQTLMMSHDLMPRLSFRGKLSHPHIILLPLQRLHNGSQRLFLALLIFKVGLHIPHSLPHFSIILYIYISRSRSLCMS